MVLSRSDETAGAHAKRVAGWGFQRPTALLGGSSVAGDETVREVAVRGSADGALREVASQKR
jgi:hypothetical protein